MPGTTGERWPNWRLALPQPARGPARPRRWRNAWRAILRRAASRSAGAAVRGARQRRARGRRAGSRSMSSRTPSPARPSMTRSARCLTLSSALPDGHPAAGHAEHDQVVLGVADGDGGLGGLPSSSQGDIQPGGLVDAGRQHHHGVLVEDDLEVQLHLVDGAHHLGLVGLPGRADRPAHRERGDPVGLQGGDEARRQGGREEALVAGGRVVEECAVLEDAEVEDVGVVADVEELVEDRPVTSTARRPLSRRLRRRPPSRGPSPPATRRSRRSRRRGPGIA